jgi:hypothetical protein
MARDCGGRISGKASTAITGMTARVVYALTESGADYRPFVEGPVPGGRTPLSVGTVRAHPRPCR